MRKLVIPTAVVLVIGGAWGVNALLSPGAGTPRPGVVRLDRPLPFIAGPILQGGSFSPGTFHGRALVVNFWNPYCTPCRGEATVLDIAWGHLSHSSVAFVGVLYSNSNFPHDVAAARRFATELGEFYPTIDDPDHAIAKRFGIRGIPTTVIADARGRIRYEVFGALKRGELERLVSRATRS